MVSLSSTGWLVFTTSVHTSAVLELGTAGTLNLAGASGSHGGVAVAQLGTEGTLDLAGRVVTPFRPPSDVRYTREATPGIVEQ